MKRPFTVLCSFMGLFLFYSLASGQYVQGQKSLGAGVSAVKLVGGDKDRSVVDYAGGLVFKYGFSERWVGALSADLGWVRPRDSDSYFQVGGGKYRTYLYPLALSLRCHVLPESRLTPYVSAGMGFIAWNLMDVSDGEDWFPIPESGESIHGRQTHLAFSAAAGLEYFLKENWSLDLGMHYARMTGQDLDNIGMDDVNEALIQVKLALNFHFGAEQDKDKDGIPDDVDASPYAAEDFDGFQDEDGKPDLDNDGDGIEDADDQAPNLPEDIDGFQDKDGVPDLDNDHDSIPDLKDECPNQPEDFDGFRDEDGCPDIDNDKDGIPDAEDQCPNQAETYNQYQDEDGCPDNAAPAPIVKQGQSLVLTGITFELGKASLTQNAKQVLQNVIDSLKDYPEIQLEIRGYTDSVGKESANLSLSQQRADAVKNYMVQSGIGFSRLRAIGFGEAHPVASNKTAEGRAKNRRIEFVRVN